nr:immunoglobulin heavy chain junction region [Macaca mulatta]MOW77323.1 immunoglobulin heavy chain junction region [Macaca mulatta]MOW77367.1 immunoglobulin heavy chain junction region [Macaca mulatta]MOW81931.1 immunoglobulin heavy chain junction region [Macaca mulatta]MOW86184.1 immunoglobulin heavy chain junction region [Macaca mulatta]
CARYGSSDWSDDYYFDYW